MTTTASTVIVARGQAQVISRITDSSPGAQDVRAMGTGLGGACRLLGLAEDDDVTARKKPLSPRMKRKGV
jgi:hypothetical protein